VPGGHRPRAAPGSRAPYSQFRYNQLPSLDPNPDLINRQGDRSIGKGGSFLIRRPA
jgi:hypothetical protein